MRIESGWFRGVHSLYGYMALPAWLVSSLGFLQNISLKPSSCPQDDYQILTATEVPTILTEGERFHGLLLRHSILEKALLTRAVKRR